MAGIAAATFIGIAAIVVTVALTGASLGVVAMQAHVGAFVNAAGLRIVRVALAEGDHVPGEAAVGVLHQSEDKAERRRGRTKSIKWDVELATARQLNSSRAIRLAALPVKLFAPSFYFFAGFLSLNAS